MTDDPGSAPAFSAELRDRLEGRSAPERRGLFLGILQKHLGPDVDAVVVGGALVEMLTEGAYTTGDVDLVGERSAIGDLLEAAGFDREGRHLVEPDLGLVVEVPGRYLDPTQRTERLRFEDYTVVALSLEDLLVDRLCAKAFWRSDTDWEQARLVCEAHRDRIDWERLRERAREERVEDLLDDLQAAVAEE